jgi:glycosyltransferase involved in cell wall biosynthesis
MKILIVLRKFQGGVGRANSEIAEVLRKKGHKVDFLSREDNLKIHSLRKSIFPLRKRIKELMKKENYDILYTQDYSMALPLLFPYPIFWRKHFCCFCGIKTKKNMKFFQGNFISKCLYPYHIFLHRITGKVMGKKLVVIGDQLKEIFPKARLIYRGVNIKNFRPLDKKRDSIGWYSSDNEIISKKDIKEISKKIKLKPLIAEYIPKNQMNNFYNKCKVFINLPRTAGFNLSWLEAMATGVPIIIGNYKGAGSFLPIEKISNNEKNKNNKIIKIIKNPKKIDYRKWLIENNFTWENKVEELIKFFGEMQKK